MTWSSIAFSCRKIEKRRKIGSLRGIITHKRLLPNTFSNRTSITLVELSNTLVLNSKKYKNELCFINHSCQPNCYMRIIRNEVEIYSLKVIQKNNELTLNYGETHHNGKLSCKCKSVRCIGLIWLRLTFEALCSWGINQLSARNRS